MSKLTTKSLTMITELLDSEQLAYKKCCAYVHETEDEGLKTLLGELANQHKTRYDSLCQILINQAK